MSFHPISEDFLGNPLEYENGLGQGFDDFTLDELIVLVQSGFIDIVQGVARPTAAQIDAPLGIARAGAFSLDSILRLAITGGTTAESLQVVSSNRRSTYDALVAAHGATNYWKLQEASGVALDSIGTTNFTSTNVSQYQKAGPIADYAIEFLGGDGESISAPLPGPGHDLSVEFWLKVVTAPSTDQAAFYNGNGGSNGFGVLLSADRGLKVLLGGVVATVETNTKLTANVWHHIVLSRGALGTKWNLIIDGVTDTFASTSSNTGTATGTATIGMGTTADVYMSRLAYYSSVALTQAQAAQHYGAASLPEATASLVADLTQKIWRTTGNPSGYDTAVAADGAANYYKMQDSNALFTDAIGSLNMTAQSGTLFRVDGPMGDYGVRFNAANAQQTGTMVSTATTNISLEAWIKVDSRPAGNDVLIYNGNSGANGYGVCLAADGGLTVTLGGVVISPSTKTKLSLGVWHHVVLSHAGSGTAWNFIIDGVTDTYATPTNNANAPSGATFRITTEAAADVSISRVAFYPVALSQATAAAHYAYASATEGAIKTSPYDVLAGIQTLSGDPLETTGVTATAVSQAADLPIDALQALSVMGSTLAFEALRTVDVAGAANVLETLRMLAIVGLAEPYEALKKLAVTSPVAFDTLLRLAVTGSGEAVEALQTVAGATYSATVLADAPAIYLKLDESSGATAFDSSGNGRNLGYHGSGITYGLASLITSGTSINLSGGLNDSYVTSTSSPQSGINANGKVSVECWIDTAWTPSGTGGDAFGMLASTDDTSGARFFQFRVNNAGKVEWIVFNTSGSAFSTSSTSVVTNGLPHHIVATYDGSKLQIYIDGVADNAGTSATFTLATSNPGLNIGRRFSSGTGQSFYRGGIDEFAIYTSALSAARVAAHYAAGSNLGAPTSVVIAEVLQGVARSAQDPTESLASAASLTTSPLVTIRALATLLGMCNDVLRGIQAANGEDVDLLRGLAILGTSPWDTRGRVTRAGDTNSESLQAVIHVATSIVEALHGLAVTTTVSFETLFALAVALAGSVESARGLSAVAVSEPEASRSISTMGGFASETVGSVAASAQIALEALQLVQQFFGDPIEAQNQNSVTNTASFPIETLLSLALSGIASAESQQLVRATSQYPVDLLLGVSALLAAPYESLLSLSVNGAAALDVVKRLANSGQLDSDSLISVSRTAAEIVEALAGTRSTVAVPISTLQEIRATIGAPQESRSTGVVSQSASMPLEALQLVQRTDVEIAETGRGASSTTAAIYEALRALAVSGATRAETVSSISQNAPMVSELTQALRVAAGETPAEVLAGLRGQILGPAESIAVLQLLATLNAETQSPGMRVMALMQAEALQRVSQTTGAPWEYFIFEREGIVVLVDAATAQALLADDSTALALLVDAPVAGAGLEDEAANWLGLTDEGTGSAVLSDGED